MTKKHCISVALCSLILLFTATASIADTAVDATHVKHFSVSTLLGDRVTADIANQPDAQGKNTATIPFRCDNGSGTCSDIYHQVKTAGQYQFHDLGNYPNITFTVRSAGGDSTAGEFTVQFPADIGGTTPYNVEILGDQYGPHYCEIGKLLTANRISGTGNLYFCLGQRS